MGGQSTTATSTDPYTLTHLPPGPGGALETTVHCSTARTGGTSTRHPLTIAADWSVTTPHDLALERIATALGGYLSCLDLADRVAPALHDLVQLHARRFLPNIQRNLAGRWTLRTLAPDCRCLPYGFASAAEAAEHGRDVGHVAKLHDVNGRDLRRLLDTVKAAHNTSFLDPPSDSWGAATRIREHDGLSQLWDAGIHPELVRRLHDALWSDGPPLRVWFYLGAATRRPDLSWITQTLAEVPDEDIAVWLAWTDTAMDRKHPDARLAWLRAGVPRRAIAALADGTYTPIDVARLAAATRRSVPSAATTLAAWHRAGCHPTPDDIATLDELDIDPWYEPSAGAIDWLWDRVSGLPKRVTRTQVALVLAVASNRPVALKLLTAGVRSPRQAAQLLPQVTTHHHTTRMTAP